MATTSTTYLDEFMDKMYLVPNDINRYLRLIRGLDKKAETVQQSLNHLQARFLHQLREFKESVSNGHSSNGASKKHQKLGHEVPGHLKTEYQKILIKQKQLYGYFKEKHEISQQLKAMVGEFYQQLETELKSKLGEKSQEEKEVFYNQRKKSIAATTGKISAVEKTSSLGGKISHSVMASTVSGYGTTGQFVYDLKEPTYCYCGRASFGQMVMCENPFCEREWFHLDCIDEKNLPQKWYCLQCQKQKDKTRNSVSRGFFVNKQAGEK